MDPLATAPRDNKTAITRQKINLTLLSQEILQNKPVQRLQEVMTLLHRPSSQEQREESAKRIEDLSVPKQC